MAVPGLGIVLQPEQRIGNHLCHAGPRWQLADRPRLLDNIFLQLVTEHERLRVARDRLRDLLGLSLEHLSRLLEAEDARAELRREYREAEDQGTRRRILEEAVGHIGTQLELVRGRRRELEALEGELVGKRRSIREKLRV